MSRFLSLLIVLALVLTNGVAIAATACQHADAHAHALARQSADAAIAAQAKQEETTAAKAMQQSALADAAAMQLGGFLVPSEPMTQAPAILEPTIWQPAKAPELANRAIRPLLEPPLA